MGLLFGVVAWVVLWLGSLPAGPLLGALAQPPGGDPLPFGGPATGPGWAAAAAVPQAMREALHVRANSRHD
jgi:hypothetical protein